MTTAYPTPYTLPAPMPANCPVCSVDRDACIREGMALCAIPPGQRTAEQRMQIGLMVSLLETCERNCRVRGGWPV